MTQESSSLFLRNADQLIRELFASRSDVTFVAAVIDSFCVQLNGKLESFTSDQGGVYVAIEGKNHQHYFILEVSVSHVETEITNVYEWGIRPLHFFFGLQQAVEIGLFMQPQVKQNLVLCSDFLTTFSFLQMGVPAILVDPKSVWKDAYFQKVIRSTFSNIIVAFSVDGSTTIQLRKRGVNVLPMDKFLKRSQAKSFYEYVVRHSQDDDFLEPLWELYEYLDDDTLTPEGKKGDFSIVESNS